MVSPKNWRTPCITRLSQMVVAIRSYIFFFIVIPSLNAAELPQSALKVLSELPDSAVTIDYVLSRAVKTSAKLKGIKASLIEADASLLRAREALDFQLNSSAAYINNQNEPETPFSFNRLVTTNYDLSLSKNFETGTTVSASIDHGRSELSFPDFGPGFQIPTLSFYQTVGSLGVKQALWRNRFGRSLKLGLDAGKKEKEAIENGFWNDAENWALEVFGLFYDAWLAKSKLELARESTATQKRLVKIVEKTVQRGTAVRSDLLQAQSALILSEARLLEAKTLLSNQWRILIITLNLPEEWEKIDPSFIPIVIDEPHRRAQVLCEEHPTKISEHSNANSEMLRLRSDAATLQAEVAEDAYNPSLDINLSLGANGIEPTSRFRTFSETFSALHPAWTASLNFSIPLSRFAKKADLDAARAERIRADSKYLESMDSLRQEAQTACANLIQLRESNQLFKTVMNNQKTRARLEERRFALGKVPAFQVVQAQEDAVEAEFNVDRNEVALRLAAWNVLRVNNRLRKALLEVMK